MPSLVHPHPHPSSDKAMHHVSDMHCQTSMPPLYRDTSIYNQFVFIVNKGVASSGGATVWRGRAPPDMKLFEPDRKLFEPDRKPLESEQTNLKICGGTFFSLFLEITRKLRALLRYFVRLIVGLNY